jgi:hypothetical protein
MSSIFAFMDDPAIAARFRQIGITENDLVKYALGRADPQISDTALEYLLRNKNLRHGDEDYVRSVVEQLPSA